MALALLVGSGVAWAVNEIGTNGPDTLRGTNRDDNLLGRGGNDILLSLRGEDNLLGGSGRDVVVGGTAPGAGFGGVDASASRGDKNLVGGSGNDSVWGGSGSDNVMGNRGNDLVVDGPDREFSTDRVSAGAGNDVVGSLNLPAYKDIVTCGGGYDRVLADARDVVAADCERVSDRPSELLPVFLSIPESFFAGLPEAGRPPF